MQKINSIVYIHDIDPEDEAVLSPSAWYVTESTMLEVVNRDTSDLNWYIAQGWVPESLDTNGFDVEDTINEVTNHYEEFYLSRRSINTELCIRDMIAQYTKAYNEGRSLNDLRYDDIINLYVAMQDATEDDLNSLEFDPDDFESWISDAIASWEADSDDYDPDLDGYGEYQRARINLAFDNKLANARQDLVSRAMYNSTVWDTIQEGVERDRELALTDLADKIMLLEIEANKNALGFRYQMRAGVIGAYNNMVNTLNSQLNNKLNIRNGLIKGLVAFMERRTDGYPDMSAVGALVEKLGTAVPTVPGAK